MRETRRTVRSALSAKAGTFNFIDLFAGIGGMRRGFEAIGGTCVFTCEWDRYAQQTYRANYSSGHLFANDIRDVEVDAVPEHDVLLAGFPCQPFSIAGVSKRNALKLPHGFRCEAQGTLFFDVVRILHAHRPRAFLLENVKNLVNHDKGRTFRVIHETLTDGLGYEVHWKVLDAKYVKVIITTNFDCLLESALREAGVEPQVISTDDQVKGAVPIVHAPCTVLKLHGDYLDTRIRNTPQELEKYSEEYDRLLDRIFDEFGLIVCGWSGEWDTALRNAIQRTASRRYTTYWTVHGELGEEGKRLIAHRKAETIFIQDAESFFPSLADHVESIEEFSRPHPLSTQIAVATAKRYIPDEQSNIRLHDLVNDLVGDLLQRKPVPATSIYPQELNARVRGYDVLCETLVAVAAVGGYWCESRHYPTWTAALSRLMSVLTHYRFQGPLNIDLYPATLLLYALGIGAVAHKRLLMLGELLALPANADPEQWVADVLAPHHLVEVQQLEGLSSSRLPLNEWMFGVLRTPLRTVLPDDGAYERAFVELEILLALSYATRKVDAWEIAKGVRYCPPGRFLYGRGGQRVREKIDRSIAEEGDSSPYVTSGIFGNTASECRERLSGFAEYTRYMAQRMSW